jgi:cell division septation protein DedD
MAREWLRVVLVALAAAMLGGVPSVQFGARAYAADDAEEGQEQTPASDAQPKGGKKRQDPVEAQRAIEAALKQVQAGRAEQAVQAVTSTLSAGNLPPGLMAKALYVRGLAYRKQGRPAQAISDLNSALWLKGGLGGEDRAEAAKERSAAYADAGLGAQSEAPAPKTGGGFFSGLFGSPTPAPTPTAQPPPRAPPPPPAPEKAEAPPATKASTAISSGWSSGTEVRKEKSAPSTKAAAVPRKAAPPPAPAKARPAAKSGGRYLVQLAAVPTEAEAKALVAKAKRDPTLTARQPLIDRTVQGNKAALYRVRFGPFGSAQESQAACAKLKRSGFDCLPIAP